MPCVQRPWRSFGAYWTHMNLNERLTAERQRLERMEAEADKALDSKGHRSPIDARQIEAQKGTIRRIKNALYEHETTGDSER